MRKENKRKLHANNEKDFLAEILIGKREFVPYIDNLIHHEKCQVVYKAMHVLWNKNEKIDLITLSEEIYRMRVYGVTTLFLASLVDRARMEDKEED